MHKDYRSVNDARIEFLDSRGREPPKAGLITGVKS